jgi:hypothetical protein
MSTIGTADVHVVIATDGENTHYWAAAVPRPEAAPAVQLLLGAGWTATLTDKHLTPDQVAALDLAAGDVREFKGAL